MDTQTDGGTDGQTDRLAWKKSLNFVPLVYKHFGQWGQTAEYYLNVLTTRARDSVKEGQIQLNSGHSGEKDSMIL